MIRAPDGREAGRLEDEGAADGEGRRDLVGRQVQGEVEGGDEGAGSDRHALPHPRVAAGARADVQGQHLAVDAHGLLRGDAEGVDQPGHLAARVPDRACPPRCTEPMVELLGALPEAPHAVIEHRLALVGPELRASARPPPRRRRWRGRWLRRRPWRRGSPPRRCTCRSPRGRCWACSGWFAR